LSCMSLSQYKNFECCTNMFYGK